MEIKVGENSKGKRLDIFLIEHLAKVSPQWSKALITRSVAAKLISKGVLVNGEAQKRSLKVEPNDIIAVDTEVLEGILSSADLDKGLGVILPQKTHLDIVAEDKDWIVINKPKGMVIHPGVGNPSLTLANFVAGYLSDKDEYDPTVERGGVVHRLDKGVSGLVIFAKNREAQLYLKKQFESRKVTKIYKATVKKLRDTQFSKLVDNSDLVRDTRKAVNDYLSGKDLSVWHKIEGKISRDQVNRRRMKFTTSSRSGKYSAMYIKVLGRESFLIHLLTGRMHQIRATLNYLGYVVIGDRLYGDERAQSSDLLSLEEVVLSVEAKSGVRSTWRLI